MSTLREVKIAELKKSISMLLTQYTAVNQQLRLEINPATKTILQAQLAHLEEQIETAEKELDDLEKDAPPPPAPTSADKVRRELYRVLSDYYNIAELHDLIYDDLGLDHETVIGSYETRKELVRELIGYCQRHGQFDKLVNIVKVGRPHAWNSAG